jgi:hypothetical protein
MYPDFNWREATMTKGYIPTVIAFALQVRMQFAAEMYLSRATAPASGIKKIRPISAPQKVPVTAPAAVVLIN